MMLEYIAIAVMIAVATLIAAIAIGLGELLGPKKKSKVKDEPYESGIAETRRCREKLSGERRCFRRSGRSGGVR